MRYFPLFLDLAGRSVLVVGDGEVAARKAAVLANAGADVEVVAERPEPALIAAARESTPATRLRILERDFHADDIAGRALVVSATGDAGRDGAVWAAARAMGIPVNVVDRPQLCSFIWPAIVDREPLTVAVCSEGTAPVLARAIRARIEAMLPANLGRLARFADSFRAAVKATRAAGPARRRFWERFFVGPVAEAVLSGDEQRAREQMLALINRREDAGVEAGRVTLVGAGPGDPELLTLQALRALQEADVIVHDRLVGPRILDYARRDAERIDAGKAPGRQPLSQDAINRLLLEHARAGRRVVRLKGGDPFIFGRGGEERGFLLAHGICCAVVPGITAALGCAAAAGIPLTLRGTAQTLSIVTARAQDGADSDLDWQALARDRQTLAIYMGAAAAGRIAARLIEAGRDASTPSAAIARGTLPDERLALGTLAELPELVRAVSPAASPGAGTIGGDPGPVLLLIGEAVGEADARAAGRLALAAIN